MRYVTATFGAILMFAGVSVMFAVACAYLPQNVNHSIITFYFGWFFLRANPTVLIAIPLASLAGVWTFRATLKRYNSPGE
jgi:hypothetical protein